MDDGEPDGYDEDYQPQMLEIVPCVAADVESLIVAGRKEGLAFSPSTELFMARLNGVIVGLCGIVHYRGHSKLKNFYVLPAHRRQGYFRQMLDFLLIKAREAQSKYVEATATALSLPEFLNRGATVKRTYKAGYTAVRLNL